MAKAKTKAPPRADNLRRPPTEGDEPAVKDVPSWPAMADFSTPEKLREAFAKFGVTVPELGAGMPSLADGLMGPMLNRLTQAPSFAHLWDMDQKLGGVAAACAALNQASSAFQQLVGKAWTQAQQNLLKKAVAPSADGQAAFDWRAGVDRWLAELNNEMLVLMRTDDYLAAQKQLLAAGLQAREQLARVGEDMAEWFQLPSRAEFDDLARSVTELRRELRRAARQQEA